MNLKDLKHIHFIGIGGIGNSAIAEIFLNKKIKVSGSDIKKSQITEKLEKKGAKIFYTHKKNNIKNPDLIVYSSAISENNPERIVGKEKKIPEINRAEILGHLMDEYERSIAISGTHGKTTTTSMLTTILHGLNLEPTALIGGNLDLIKGNALIKSNTDLFITEACEYKENFLNFNPKYGVILNIDEDHLDYYDDLNHIIEAFFKFAKNIQPDGALFLNSDDFNTKKISQIKKFDIITFGINSNSVYKAKNIIFDSLGHSSFDIFYRNKFLANCNLKVPGTHNIYNALAAISISHYLKNDINSIIEQLQDFKGAHRRFEYMGKLNGATIIDDYAHHPTEIKATLDAARKLDSRKTICVFQPHTYSRTKELLPEFSNAFNDSDEIIILDIYAARENNTYNITSEDLVNEIKKEKDNVKFIKTLSECENYLKQNVENEDLVLLLGAGNIRQVSENIVK